MRLRAIMLAAALAAGITGSAQAQSNAEQRAAELAELATRLNDPDPMMRLAAMEEVLRSGDRIKITVATGIAMQSDNRLMRGLAMLGFLATQENVSFDVVFPERIETEYAKLITKQEDVQRALKRLTPNDNVPYLLHLQGRKLTVAFDLTEDLLSGKAFMLASRSGRTTSHEGELRINGDRAEMFFPEIVIGGVPRSACWLSINPVQASAIGGEFKCGSLTHRVAAEIR